MRHKDPSPRQPGRELSSRTESCTERGLVRPLSGALSSAEIHNSPRLLSQRRTINQLFGRDQKAPSSGMTPVVQRVLMMDNPDGTKPAIKLEKFEQFDTLQPGTRLFLTEMQEYVVFHGQHRQSMRTVVIDCKGALHLYAVHNGERAEYRSGSPDSVVMEFNKVLNGDVLQDGGGVACGLLFDWHATWPANETSPPENGMLISEVIIPESSSGWLAGSESRVQQRPVALRPGERYADFLGITTSGNKASTEVTVVEGTDGESAAEDSSGSATVFQYFNYLGKDGKWRPVPRSGYRISKQMAGGLFTIKREPAAGHGTQAGGGAAVEKAIEINFGGDKTS